MEILDKNAMTELATKVQVCDYPFNVHCSITILHGPVCTWLDVCRLPFWCRRQLFVLVDKLKGCGPKFYHLCDGVDRILVDWPDFEPAIEAAALKERELLERVASLEAQVKQIQPRKGA